MLITIIRRLFMKMHTRSYQTWQGNEQLFHVELSPVDDDNFRFDKEGRLKGGIIGHFEMAEKEWQFVQFAHKLQAQQNTAPEKSILSFLEELWRYAPGYKKRRTRREQKCSLHFFPRSFYVYELQEKEDIPASEFYKATPFTHPLAKVLLYEDFSKEIARSVCLTIFNAAMERFKFNQGNPVA